MKTGTKGVIFLLGWLTVTCLYADELDILPSSAILDLPAGTAHIADYYPPTLRSVPDYILIQDLHRHPEVQQHIAEILMQAHRQWGLRQVLVEGAFSLVPISSFGRLTFQEHEQDIQRWLQEGQLTGAELAAAMVAAEGNVQSGLRLEGIEDRLIYEEHVAVYQKIMEQRELALKEIDRIHHLQEELYYKVSNPMTDQLERVRLLIQLKMTPATYADYLTHKALSPVTALLAPIIEASERFYQLADARNDVFLRNAAYCTVGTDVPHVLIVGGFHTEGLSRRLRAQGHSYIVLAPTVTQGGYDGLYEKRMMNTVSALQISNNKLNSY